MTADTAFKFLQFLARKNQVAQITAPEFNTVFNTAQRQYFSFCLGDVEQFVPGRNVPRVALGMSARLSNALSPFKKVATPTVTAGAATYPADFYTLISMTDSFGRNIQRVDDNNSANRLNSVIDPPTDTTNPFFIEDATGWKIYPASTTSISVYYYRLPAAVVWASTLDSNNRPVYNAAASTAPEWDDVSCDKILARAAGLLGFSFDDRDLVVYSQQVKAAGE